MNSQQKPKPFVSIVLSSFNDASTIGRCLVSLKGQTYSNFEVIIVDEYSTDQTRDISRKYGARVYEHRGERSICRNFGIQHAKGHYVMVLDSDMELECNVLRECVGLAEKGARAIAIKEKSEGQGFWSEVRALERSCYYGDDTIEAARFFEKELITQLGGYDPGIVGAEDWDLHQKIIKKGIIPLRTTHSIIHREGKLSFWRLVRKKAYYGLAFNEFKRRYPDVFSKAVLRKSLLKNWKRLIRQPIHGAAFFFLRCVRALPYSGA